ncbi:hypothetical protein NEOC65_000191 [Neochlamydia sp. AcF65]|nr:hypothetical protein [Neochlamydia sp. AcF65]
MLGRLSKNKTKCNYAKYLSKRNLKKITSLPFYQID